MSTACPTRELLLSTMIELIWENSYSAVSVDDICQRAGVKKGSFYHFFPSKSDLAVHAMEHHWQSQVAELDQVFSAQLPAWERFAKLSRGILATQEAKQKSFGKLLGCPFLTIGSEMSTQDEKIRQKSERMTHCYLRYYESTIREGMAQGDFAPGDAAEKARQAFAFVMGLLLQAKVSNDLAPLRLTESGLRNLLGVRAPVLQAA